jgi:hypothetical protein
MQHLLNLVTQFAARSYFALDPPSVPGSKLRLPTHHLDSPVACTAPQLAFYHHRKDDLKPSSGMSSLLRFTLRRIVMTH